MQYHTVLVAEVPRVRCAAHGVVQIAVPWPPQLPFTALFEALVIDWLREASFTAVARRLALSWGQVAGIQARRCAAVGATDAADPAVHRRRRDLLSQTLPVPHAGQ